MATEAIGWWGVPLGILAGTLRGSAPFLFVKFGGMPDGKKVANSNLGLEGTLLMGAMSAYAISYLTGRYRWPSPFSLVGCAHGGGIGAWCWVASTVGCLNNPG